MNTKIELKDWLNSINFDKKNLMEGDSEAHKSYAPYIINKCLSGNYDCLAYVNEMNLNPHLDKKMQYDFYINILRAKRRYAPWLKKNNSEDLDYVKRYYGYNNDKAEQALKLLTTEQINFIKSRFDTGGRK
jgi:hypothetical protein